MMRVIPTKPTRQSVHLNIEELESRLCPTSVCNVNPTYEAECNYLNNLIPTSAATVTAVQSGNWSNPATWGGKLPGNGDNVWIPHGITVTVDKQEPGQLRSILDNGVLTFAANVNTSLSVNTVVVGTDNNPTGLPEGELDIGTAAHPIQSGVTAQLTFADLGPQSQLFPNDGEELSGGLISMGTLNIYGSTVTPWVNMNNAAAGATTLTLTSQPTGWKVGDTLLIPGTSPTAIQDEQIQIAALRNNSDGTTTVTLASPLQYAHAAPTGQAVQVADENRSVVIQSQDATNQDGAAGQVMQMHNDAASVQYAALLNLGRTDKSVPLNNTQLDANGNPIPATGTNQVGRYALHFHRDYYPGLTDKDAPIPVIGNFEMGSPGWGYDNHSSNVNFIDNVAFDNFGSAFVDEAGNELGTFQNNLAINTPGVPTSFNLMDSRSDYGWGGEGFWLTSPSTSVVNNHVWEAQIGYAIYTLGLVQPGLGRTTDWSGKLPHTTPLAPFSGNTAGEVAEGLNVQWQEPLNNVYDTIDHFAAWDVTYDGIVLYRYTNNTNLVDDTLLAAPGANIGIAANPNGYSFNLNVTNADVEGFQTGYSGLSSSLSTVQGGYWDDTTALSFPAMASTRKVVISGPITFGPHVSTEYSVQSADLAAYVSNANNSEVTGYPNNIFSLDQILLPNGQQLFAQDQAPNYVPFPLGSNANLPAQWIGLTNAQLWAQYGVAPGGVVAPTGSTGNSLTNGLIGSAQATTTTTSLNSSAFGWVGAPYQLKYTQHPANGASQPPMQTDPKLVNLQPGWNVITRTIKGTSYSWLVYGNIFNPTLLPTATVGLAYNQSITPPTGYTITYRINSGAIPPGLTFTNTGNILTITGTPQTAGSVSFTVTATSSFGGAGKQQYTLTVYPQNVSGQVTWSASAPTHNPSAHSDDGTITLTNNGPTTLMGTLMVLLTGLLNEIAVINANGYFNGNPYILVNLPNGGLAAGQSLTFAVHFHNPHDLLIGYSIATYEQSI